VSPSIVTGDATVSFALAQGASASCLVYDAAGNVVAQLADGMLGAGEHRLNLSGASLQPGIYFCKLQSGKSSATARLAVVR
jgi:hypothetical protein